MKNLDFYVDKKKVKESEIEQYLLDNLKNQENQTIVLRAEEGVPIEKAVKVLDIANRNKIKSTLAVKSN